MWQLQWNNRTRSGKPPKKTNQTKKGSRGGIPGAMESICSYSHKFKEPYSMPVYRIKRALKADGKPYVTAFGSVCDVLDYVEY